MFNLFLSGSSLCWHEISWFQPKSFTSRLSAPHHCNIYFACHHEILRIFSNLNAIKRKVLSIQGLVFLVFNILGILLLEYSWDACNLCVMETMETAFRTSALGSCLLFARIGAVMSPIVRIRRKSPKIWDYSKAEY